MRADVEEARPVWHEACIPARSQGIAFRGGQQMLGEVRVVRDSGMTKERATAKLRRVHTHLRGKAEVLETLALKVLRGDEDLGSALRLKADELQRHLLHHMIWEEDQLIPLLTEGEFANSPRWVELLRERRQQRLQLSRSLLELQHSNEPAGDLAKQCLVLVEALEAAIMVEERDVLPSILKLELAQKPAVRRPVRPEAARGRTPR